MSAFIDAHRVRLGVEPICRELEVSVSAYRARRTRPPSDRTLRDAFLLAQIRRVHAESGDVYGQLKVWDELNESGIAVARCTIERLMRRYGIVGVGPAKTKKTTLPGERPVAAPDLVKRNFTAVRPDQLWLADFERHEALSNRAVMKGHRLRPVAAGRRSWGQPGWRGRASPVASSPDNAGTSQYRQMIWVRQARREGVREKPASESPSSEYHRLEPDGSGPGLRCASAYQVAAGDSFRRLMSPVGRPR